MGVHTRGCGATDKTVNFKCATAGFSATVPLAPPASDDGCGAAAVVSEDAGMRPRCPPWSSTRPRPDQPFADMISANGGVHRRGAAEDPEPPPSHVNYMYVSNRWTPCSWMWTSSKKFATPTAPQTRCAEAGGIVHADIYHTLCT
eukprot:gene21264-25551_t